MNPPANHKNLDQKIEEISKLDQDKCLELLNEVFFNSNKSKATQHHFLIEEETDGKTTTKKNPEDNLRNRYKELSAIAAAVIKRLDELDKKAKIDSVKDILGDLSKEEILKALGIKLPKDTSVDTSTEDSKPKIKIQYVNLKGEIATAEVAEAGNTPKKNGIHEFVKYAKDEKNILRPAIAAMTEVEFKNTFADYIAKVKAQAA